MTKVLVIIFNDIPFYVIIYLFSGRTKKRSRAPYATTSFVIVLL